jgi:hypothetical protein
MATMTKGNVIVENINVGDIHYEYEYSLGIKCEVLTKPILNEAGNWEWKSRNLKTEKEIVYIVNPKYPHYSANLYDYEAYKVNYYI